eukprot:294098-Rhodomonas_salina.3
MDGLSKFEHKLQGKQVSRRGDSLLLPGKHSLDFTPGGVMQRSRCDTAAVIRAAEWKSAPVKPSARGSSSSSFTKCI